MSETSSERSRRGSTWAALGLLVLAVGSVGGFLLHHQRDIPVELLDVPVDPAAWTAYVTAVSSERDPPAAQAAPVLAAMVQVNLRELVSETPASDPEFHAAAARMHEAVWHFVQGRSAEEYLQLGRRQGFELADKLAALVDHCAGRPLLACARAPAGQSAVVDAYAATGGRFVEFAEQHGFVVAGRLVDERLPFLQGVFLQHWLRWGRPRLDLVGHLRPEEMVWFWRFRVERQKDAPLEARLAAVEALRGSLHYPADLHAGVLLYEAGRFAEAEAAFARAEDSEAQGGRAAVYRRMAARALASRP